MTESIVGSTEFIGTKCDSWSSYKVGKCEGNAIAMMGENISFDARGRYFLATNSEAPYAQGDQMTITDPDVPV